jgi:hypothetical protein
MALKQKTTLRNGRITATVLLLVKTKADVTPQEMAT